jgi:hypothetical protein
MYALPLFFHQIYCVIFSYIQLKFPQTSECFHSNDTNNMHILANGAELQAVSFGYVFRWKWMTKGCSHNRLMTFTSVIYLN